MCGFCSFEKEYGETLIDLDGSESCLRLHKTIDGRFEIRYDKTHVQQESGIVNYCPVCGRKLSEEKD